jgi:SAM-dependent methyltransferase
VTASATPPATSAASHCAWCGREFDDRDERLPGLRDCHACGAATTDPWPDDEALDVAYADWYRPPSGRFAGPGDIVLKRTRGLLAHRLDRLAAPGTVLDVGAGDGTLLDALHARGRPAVGLERESDRPDVLAAELDDVEGPFAAIVFWHSLEHLRDPRAALARAVDLLVPDGVLVVALPNRASVQARAFGQRWLALDLPRHLVHVPAGALRARLRELGLSLERESHLRGGQVVFGWLHGLVGLLPGSPDLYDAIRRPSARQSRIRASGRVAALALALVLLPAAVLLALLEAMLRRGGSVYVEARRPA